MKTSGALSYKTARRYPGCDAWERANGHANAAFAGTFVTFRAALLKEPGS
jgi:hypothetical protein